MRTTTSKSVKHLSSNKLSDLVKIHDKDFRLLIDEAAIKERIKSLAKELTADYREKRPLVLSILNGSFIFSADLLRELSIPLEIDFVKVSSYSGISSSGEIKNLIGLNQKIEGRHILILEDIIDSGLTVSELKKILFKQNPTSIELITLLLKPLSLKHDIKIKYVGFEISDAFVIGYGLDYDGLGRNLKGIYQAE